MPPRRWTSRTRLANVTSKARRLGRPVRSSVSDSCTASRSSSIRRLSSRDILLNSSPRPANSSLPTVVTWAEKSPPASLRAASRKPASCCCSERDTSDAHASASNRKPTRIPPIFQRPAWSVSTCGTPSVMTWQLLSREADRHEGVEAVAVTADLDGLVVVERGIDVAGAGQRRRELLAAVAHDDLQPREPLHLAGVGGGVDGGEVQHAERRRSDLTGCGTAAIAGLVADLQRDVAAAHEDDPLDAAAREQLARAPLRARDVPVEQRLAQDPVGSPRASPARAPLRPGGRRTAATATACARLDVGPGPSTARSGRAGRTAAPRPPPSAR